MTLENGALLYNVFMEYAPHGTLADAVRKRKGGLREPQVARYARQILLGLNYLHSKAIVHCDVKGQNVLVTKQGAKIADFGCARRVADSDDGGVIAGTPAFMAPEVARGEEQGFPADVWALGCTVLEMITGEAPWHDVSHDPVTVLYRIGFSGEVPEIPSYVPEEGKDFLGKCLKRDPRERWSVGDLLGHGFVSVLEEFEFLGTPTSVLDQGSWETLETEQDQTEIATRDCCCSWNCAGPRDRIRGLCGEDTMLVAAGPNWEWDHGWVTVRSNEAKEFEGYSNGQGSNVPEANEKTEDCRFDTVYIVIEENSLVVFDELKSNVVAFRTGLSRCSANIGDCYFSSNHGCCNTESLYGCSCIEIVPQGKIESLNTQIMLCFLLSLSASLIDSQSKEKFID